MLKALPLVILALCISASSQTAFTNGPSACNYSALAHSYYCPSAQTFDAGGNFSGYVGMWFVLNADNTFSGGQINISDTSGHLVLTANDFTGTFTGTKTGALLDGVVNGTFNLGAGSLTENLFISRHCNGRYGCVSATAESSGSGSY